MVESYQSLIAVNSSLHHPLQGEMRMSRRNLQSKEKRKKSHWETRMTLWMRMKGERVRVRIQTLKPTLQKMRGNSN